MPEERVGDIGVVHFLAFVVDRLGVNAFAAGGVVLNLDGQRAVDAFDKNALVNGDEEIGAVPFILTFYCSRLMIRSCPEPCESNIRVPIIMLWREVSGEI